MPTNTNSRRTSIKDGKSPAHCWPDETVRGQGELSPENRKHLLAARAAAGKPRFAVISDIHGNVEALKSVLHFLDHQGVTGVLCLGDIVGYGPSPSECIALLREREIPCLRGNHDELVLANAPLGDMHPDAAVGIRYARRCLSRSDQHFLASLPSAFVFSKFAFVHASFPDPTAFDYVFTSDDAEPHLASQPAPVSFFGHTHRQGGFYFCLGGASDLSLKSPVPLDFAERMSFNPGAVGQPRDRDPRAAFLICNAKLGVIEFQRVTYDVDCTAAAIDAVGLPRRLATRLRLGR